jgi:hypothetical protein
MADKLGALTQLMQRIVHSIPEQYGAKQVLRAKQLGDRHMTLRNQLLEGKDLSHYATIEEFLKNADPRASSHSMIASAMKDAARAPKYWNEDYRLLELPGPTDDALNGALGFYTPGHWQGTSAENAVYIQNLGGLEQGAGSALLRELARRYPGNPMVLESLPIHGTKQFYNNRGFVPQGRNVIIPGSEHENFWLSRGADLKKRGGLVKKGPLSCMPGAS